MSTLFGILLADYNTKYYIWAHIENGVFTCQTRTAGFDDTGHEPFIFAFLVRDEESE